MSTSVRHTRGAVLLFAGLLLAGCSPATTRRSASVVDYLYPARKNVTVSPSVPVLSLPLKVGIAFVPSVGYAEAGVTEQQRQVLLDSVASHFRKQRFVKSIQVIPTSYLTAGGGFENLDQIRKLFDIDVVTLVSYDQTQFTNSGRSSITYWTIVGAYLIEGEKNETRTLLDAAVFDIASRKLLFRAPGTSAVKGSSTPVDALRERRQDAEKGFTLASKELVANLGRELEAFKVKMREQPNEVTVVARPEYVAQTGGGAGGGAADTRLLVLTLTLATAVAFGTFRRRK